MERYIKELTDSLLRIQSLKEKLNDTAYWVKKAQEETGFIPSEGDWIHVEVSLYHIRVSVYHRTSGGGRYWVNGKWSNHSFDSNHPDLEELNAKLYEIH